jgi:hypothetical protein
MMESELWINIEDTGNNQKLCVECFNCKIKGDTIFCKIGVWSEKRPKIITYVPQEFDCPEYEEA